MIKKILSGLAVVIGLAICGLCIWLYAAPPELLRVGDGYAAKIVCSNVFLAGRDAKTILSEDVQAPGNPLLRLIAVTVDRDAGVTTARFAGLFATSRAVYRQGLGCTSVPDGNIEAVKAIQLAAQTTAKPQAPGLNIALDPNLSKIVTDANLTGPGLRAIVVLKDGRIVAETYGQGFDSKTPLIGWSMTKTINAALIGRLMMAHQLSFDDKALLPAWRHDGRADIRLADLMAMKSGLAFDEDYGDVSDVSRMLYLESDAAAFAAGKPLTAKPGERFSYSTGTSVILSRIWMNRLSTPQAALSFPRDALFTPLGMDSAVLETDAHGTFAAGSYLYATPRDWARFGQFLLQDGVWQDQRLLPEGFVKRMATSNGSAGGYGQVQAWVQGPREADSGKPAGLPADTFWLEGHDGQSIAIIPSRHLVVVRMGLTPWKMGYGPEPLVKAILAAGN